MTNIRMTVEYDGRHFCGWQNQKNGETVQARLEKAMTIIMRTPVRVQGASRTDAGVHAVGQTINVKLPAPTDPNRLMHSINALCRPYIAVTEAQPVPDDWNARFNAIGKYYRYRILSRSAPSPLRALDSWHLRMGLNIDLMKQAADAMVGTHNFAGFQAADCGRTNTIRTMRSVEVQPTERGMLEIHVKGDAFLKNMVRIMVGTMVDIGRGKLPANRVEELLQTGLRTRAGQTAPPQGLTLMKVFYE